MDDEEILSLNVWVDKEKKRVVFAEASSDFIDALFSFLTLPLGTITKLLSNNCGLGSIDNLYDSIQQLNDQHFSNKACRNMLLSPRREAAEHCEDLHLDADCPREFYVCKMDACLSRPICHYSSVWETRCPYCGNLMDVVGLWEKIETAGVFVKRNGTKFMITDDFRVTASSVLQYYHLLKEFGVKDIDLLEEWTLEFGREELLNLLKEFLIGNKALTRVCFPDLGIRCITPLCNNWLETKQIRSKGNAELETQEILIKLIMNRTNNKVVCAEVGKEFVDQLFSFLTFPLGSVLMLIGCSNSFGCMTNLYQSIQELKLDCFRSEEEKNMLISPQLPPFFGYQKQMLNIKGLTPYVTKPITGCCKCYWDNNGTPCSTIKCKHGVQKSYFIELDPMFTKADGKFGGGFVRSGQNFVVTDDLHVTPMSLLSFTQILQNHGLHADHLVHVEMNVGRAQVCDLLRAMLISKTALSDAFSSRPNEQQNLPPFASRTKPYGYGD